MDFLKASVVITLHFLLLTDLIDPIHAQNSPKDFLAAHNAARAQVGVQPLVWDDAIASYAQNHANKRAADNCEFGFSTGSYGENLAQGPDEFSGTDAVNMWVGQKQFYDNQSNDCVGKGCLYYTQVVWRESLRLGCGRAKCPSGWWFVTCNYDPQGNVVGERPY